MSVWVYWSWNWNWNWNWKVELGVTVVIIVIGFLHLMRFKYSNSNNNFRLLLHPSSISSSSSATSTSNSNSNNNMVESDSCAVCATPASKQCSACKSVKYCSQTCQTQHWKSEHKNKCKDLQLSNNNVKKQPSSGHGKNNLSIALVPSSGHDRMRKLVDKVLFPYDEFVKLFNWDKQIFPPCGLLNCGNSCFANVVLQCLAHTRPLVAYLLDKGHRRDCKRNEWCFLCELQSHMERASRGQQPFSPINILSRLPTIGGNLGYGKQEDAHEFMRFAIDKMQSVCLDEYGGENFIHPKSQETTLIQHIFGGQLQSQVVCTQCSQVSRQYENMMDLTVEIQGDATSLEECLAQFTTKEWLHGDNMYKCDGCNDYVKAWKCLTIHQAPNTLTIALKRFQSGSFGKINKRITFPETLDLSPYTSGGRDGTDIYKLYAVVVHVDMLNASFFGHYICYTKGFLGNWYKIDDCKVMQVELDEVLSQGAYMLMYSRVSPRPTCLKTFDSPPKQQEENKVAASSSKHVVSDWMSARASCCYGDEQLKITGTLEDNSSEDDSASVDGGLEESGIVNSVSAEALENGNYTCKRITVNGHHAQSHKVGLSYFGSVEQSTGEVFDLSGSSLGATAASYNSSGANSMSLEETNGHTTVDGFLASRENLAVVGQRSEDELSVSVSGIGNDETFGVERIGTKVAALEDSSSCDEFNEPIDVDISIRESDLGKMGDEEATDHMVELSHTEINESDDRSSEAADGTLLKFP